MSRSLLINTMPKGSKAQILLRADRNVQRRCVRPLHVVACAAQPDTDSSASQGHQGRQRRQQHSERDLGGRGRVSLLRFFPLTCCRRTKVDAEVPAKRSLAGASEEDLLRSVRRYRETFARLLVVVSLASPSTLLPSSRILLTRCVIRLLQGARLRRLEGASTVLRLGESASY